MTYNQKIIAELIKSFLVWEPDVRVVGNVQAGDAVSSLSWLLNGSKHQNNDELLSENKKLRAFANDIMEAWPDGGIEGDDLQEIAYRHGMLAKHTHFEPCGEWCNCNAIGEFNSDDWQRGVNCYRRTALLTGEAE